MVRTISATEAKVNFGAVARRVVEDDEPVVVANHGQPTVAIIPAERLDRLNELEEQEKRRIALERIRRVQESVSARNRDLTPEQADAIAEELVDDAVNALFEKGIVRYAE